MYVPRSCAFDRIYECAMHGPEHSSRVHHIKDESRSYAGTEACVQPCVLQPAQTLATQLYSSLPARATDLVCDQSKSDWPGDYEVITVSERMVINPTPPLPVRLNIDR